jgi:hypothetical protein
MRCPRKSVSYMRSNMSHITNNFTFIPFIMVSFPFQVSYTYNHVVNIRLNDIDISIEWFMTLGQFVYFAQNIQT